MPPAVTAEELRQRVRAILPGITDFRHALHRIPEPSFSENATAALIRDRAAATRLQLRPPVVHTDTVGRLDGRSPGPCVLLRADIDALPMDDRSGTPYASETPGFSHACGHDGHAAMLMGALEVLDGLADRFDGHILFVFQPAEEEKGGGREMIQQGLLDIPPVPCAAFALHGWPGLGVGRIASKPGPIMAAQDRFTVRLIGRGGHAAKPHETIDPVVLAAQVILAFQSIISRRVNPLHPAVLSTCTVHGGTASNVIPGQVDMTGTLRYLDHGTKERMVTAMEQTVQHLAAAAGAQGEFVLHPGYIATLNDPEQTRIAEETVRRHLGEEAWVTLPEPSMGAEDFAYFLDRIPGAMLRVGVGEQHPALHNPAFDFEDAALENGIITLAALALETLAQHK